MIIFIIALAIGSYFYIDKNKENYSSIITYSPKNITNGLILTPPYPQNVFESKKPDYDYQQFQYNMKTNGDTCACGSKIGISQLPQDSNNPQEFVNF